ncbi:MAG: hypothetical protein WCF36_00235 [Candidatus Nanopelagicales bacterium]
MRRIVAALLIIVATLLAPFAVGALWAERTLMDAEQFAQTLAPLSEDPVVKQTISTEVAAALVEALDAQGRIEEVLGRFEGPLAGVRPGGDTIASSIASGVNGAIESGVDSYVNSERFGSLWNSVAITLQARAAQLIEGDQEGAALALADGQIVLDTKVAVDLVAARLAEQGVPFVDTIEVPGRSVVLADTPNLQLTVDALRIFLPVASWMWLVVLGMFAIGILLWRPRARGVLWTGLGLTLGALATYAGLNLGMAQLVDSAPSGFAGLFEILSATVLRFLVNALLVMLTLGVVLVIGGWLAGATSSGRRVRSAIEGSAQGWGDPLAEGPLGRFTAAHPMLVPTLRALVLGAALAFLLLADRLSPAIVAWTAAAAAVALLLVEVIEGSGRAHERGHSGALVAPATRSETSTE